MQQRLFVDALAAVAAAVILTGCGGAAPSGRQDSSVICVAAPAPSVVIYPQNGANGVPDGNFTLVVSGGSQTVDLAIGTSIVISNLTATGPQSNPAPPEVAYGYAVPALKPLTAYSVMAYVARSGCYDPNKVPWSQLSAISSFTTE